MTETKKIVMKEPVKKILEDDLKESLENLTEDEVIEKARTSNKVVLKFKENGQVQIKQVLHG